MECVVQGIIETQVGYMLMKGTHFFLVSFAMEILFFFWRSMGF